MFIFTSKYGQWPLFNEMDRITGKLPLHWPYQLSFTSSLLISLSNWAGWRVTTLNLHGRWGRYCTVWSSAAARLYRPSAWVRSCPEASSHPLNTGAVLIFDPREPPTFLWCSLSLNIRLDSLSGRFWFIMRQKREGDQTVYNEQIRLLTLNTWRIL